LALFLINT